MNGSRFRLSDSFSFYAEHFDIIEERANELRDSEPALGAEIQGFIVGLHSENTSTGGEAVIACDLSSRPSATKVKVQLSAEGYNRAIEAHRAARQVRTVGTLVKRGRTYVLEQPSGIDVVEDADID